METLGRVWNRLSIRRPTLATPEPVEEEDDMTPEKTKEVFQMFKGAPTRRKSENAHSHRVVLNQLQNHPPRNATQSPQRQPRTSESSMDFPRSALRRNSTDTHVFANRTHNHRDIRPEEDYYVMIDTASKSRQTATSSSGEPQDPSAPAAEQRKQKSTLQQWISTTLTAMAEISEQVVSARDD